MRHSRRYPQHTDLWEPDAETGARLQALQAAFARNPVPCDPVQALPCWNEHEVAIWQQIQTNIPSSTQAYADVACLLACYGRDYPANLRRLLRPYRLWQNYPAGHDARRPDTNPGRAFTYLPGHLARLYHRWRDPEVLGWLLVCPLPGRKARMAGYEALVALWDRHFIPILRAAAESTFRPRRIAAALGYACLIVEEPLLWKAYTRHLRHALYTRERPVMRGALGVLAELKQQQRSNAQFIKPTRPPGIRHRSLWYGSL